MKISVKPSLKKNINKNIFQISVKPSVKKNIKKEIINKNNLRHTKLLLTMQHYHSTHRYPLSSALKTKKKISNTNRRIKVKLYKKLRKKNLTHYINSLRTFTSKFFVKSHHATGIPAKYFSVFLYQYAIGLRKLKFPIFNLYYTLARFRCFLTALYIETLWREKLITTFTEKHFYTFARLHYHYCSPWVPGGVSNFKTLAKRGFYLATVNLGKKKELIKKQQLINFKK